MKKKIPAAAWILAAMVAGIVIGYMIFVQFPDKKSAAQIAGYVSIGSDVFLRLIKMLIGPLVFSTLVVGIAHMGDAASVGRVFAKAIGWFVTAVDTFLDMGRSATNAIGNSIASAAVAKWEDELLTPDAAAVHAHELDEAAAAAAHAA